MTDLATLGFQVNSEPLARAKGAMQDMVPAARGAQTAVDGMVDAVNRVKPASDGLAASAGRTGQALGTQSAVIARLDTAFSALAAQLARFEQLQRTSLTHSEAMVASLNHIAQVNANVTQTNVTLDQSTKRAGDSLSWQTKVSDGLAVSLQRASREMATLSQTQSRINSVTGVTGWDTGSDRGADIAAYGQAMDALRARFNPLFAAQRQYRQELIDLRGALRQGAISQKEYADALMNTKVAFTSQVNSIRGVSAKDDFFEQTATGAARAGKAFQGLSFDARNLSFQMVDVAQGLAMGQSPMMIFAQQAGQIGQIAATSEKGIKGLFAEIGSGIAKVLTPMRLLTVGLVAIGAAVTAAVLSWKNYALQLDDVRRLAETSSKAISGLNSAAAIKGISDDEFFSGMKAFSQNVYEARNNMGSMASLLRANGTAATTTEATFGKIADLVKNARNDVQRMNILQAAGLPTTRQWVDFMAQGSAKIQLIAAGMRSLGGPDNDRLIEAAKKFDEKWNEIWRNISLGIKSFGLSFIQTIESITNSTAWKVLTAGMELFNAARAARSAMFGGGTPSSATTPSPANDNLANRSTVANSRVAGAFDTLAAFEKARQNDPTKDDAELKKRIADEQQRISLLGDLASVEDQVRSKELELSSAWLNSGVGVGKYKDAILNAVRAQAEMSRVQQQVSIGVFNLDAANKAAADTLQMWIDKKLLDPTNAQQMAAAQAVLSRNTRELADAASVAGSNLPQLQQAMNDANNANKTLDQLATGSLNTLTSGLADIVDGTKSVADGFRDMGRSILRMLTEAAIKAAIVAPIIRSVFGGATGGGGLLSFLGIGGGATGVLASIHHSGGVAGGSNITRMVDPALFIGAPRYHNGGFAGLAPDEVPAILQRGERITPRGASNDNGAMQVEIGVTVDDDGKLQAYVKNQTAPLHKQISGVAKVVGGQQKASQSQQRYTATGVY